MNEIQEHSFRTKTGICIITPQQIILERQGIRGEVAKTVFGNSIYRALVVYIIIGMGALAFGIYLFYQGDNIFGAIYCIAGLLCLRNVFASRNNSAVPVIERSAIQLIEAHPPHAPFTRGYFSIWFMDNGQKRRRLVILAGSLSRGNEEYQKALLAIRETGLLKF
jgi:hypothetical protein